MIHRNTITAVSDAPTIQWANGKSVSRPAHTPTGSFTPYIGFHAEAGRDANLDAAMRRASIPQIDIKHQRQGGVEIVRHWDLGEYLDVFPLTSGPVATTVGGCLGRNARTSVEAGLGVCWPQGERSKLAIRGFLVPLVAVGYLKLVQLYTRSHMTDRLLAALIDHARVCEIADTIVDRAKHPELVTLHEIALPLGPGSEQEWGKSDTATVVPFVSSHPQAIDAPYLRALWRAEALHTAALAAWPGIVAWAADFALRGEEVAHA